MRKLLYCILGFSLLFSYQTDMYGKKAAKQGKLTFSEDADDVVYYIPQFTNFEQISHIEMVFLKKTLKKAEKNNVKAVIFEIDTPGGRVDYALKYISVLAKSKVPTIAYVNPNGISAGMIVALGADRIAMNPNGVIGDAMPMQMGPKGVKPITEKPEEPEKKEKKEESEKKEKEKEKAEEDKKEEDSDKKEKEKSEEKKTLKKILKEIDKLKKGFGDKKDDKEEKKIADQKFLTVFFKVLEVLAKKNDRPVRVIRAMADPYQKLSLKEDGIDHTKKSPLTLSAEEAQKLNVIDYICDDKDELIDKLGLGDCEVVEIRKSFFQEISSFLAYPVISGILIMLGILGLYIEIRTPGFGVPGILGVTALTLFFLGHIGAGDSSWGPAVVFFVGIILLALEVFVIPGFGIVGVLGICCILTSLFMAFGFENFQTSVYVIGMSLLGAIVLMFVLTIYVLPKSTLFKRITLSTEQHKEDGFSSHEKRDDSLVGKTGEAYTTLRPAGIMMLEGKRYDVMTDGDFIEKGESVTVAEVSGIQIIVRKA